MHKKDQNTIVREKFMSQKYVEFTCGVKDTLGRIQEEEVYCIPIDQIERVLPSQ